MLHSRINPGATIAAVAEAAKVSKTTVSHVLSGKRPVSQATRLNVLRVMEDLGFQPNYFAQALIANRSLAVALIVQDLTNPYYPLLGRGLQLAIGPAGYVVMLFDGAARPEAAEAAIKTAVQRRVDGVVIATAGIERAAPMLRQAGIAAVAVGSGPAVGVDDIEAAALLRPSLTTVRIPTLEIGRTAGTLLLDRLAEGAGAPARHILVQHSLIVRQSA